MSPNQIKALITISGKKQKDLLEKLGCTKSELSQIINGHRINRQLRDRLAREFGLTAAQMFDDEFEAVVSLRRTA